MTISIAGGRWAVPLDEAKAAVAGYAFAVRAVGDEWSPKWGYRMYDCVPASPGSGFSDLDILVAAGLNGQLNVAAIGALRLATRRAEPYLAKAAGQVQEFSELTLSELASTPQAGTAGCMLSLAWHEMMRTPHVGTALTHKVLHHKKPALFPLLDRRTADVLRIAGRPGSRNPWQVIWTDIDHNRAELEELRAWFADLASERRCPPLGLLRLHDILTWLHAVGQWEAAVNDGQ